MEKPILYYWAPCPTCSVAVHFAQENGIDLDLRDVEQQGPFDELTALGGDADNIPFLYVDGQLIEGNDAVLAKLGEMAS